MRSCWHCGVEIVTPPTADLEPGVKRALRLRDPDGFLSSWSRASSRSATRSRTTTSNPPRSTTSCSTCRDQTASEAFYQEALGFKLTDRFIGGLSFWACNANHHSLAFGSARDGIPASTTRPSRCATGRSGSKRSSSLANAAFHAHGDPGRHLFGNNLFSYYKDPEGNTVEYTAEVEQLLDPTRQPRVMAPVPISGTRRATRNAAENSEHAPKMPAAFLGANVPRR